MYQQERGKNDVNKTESRNTIFPKYFSSNLLFHAPPFQESNRIERFQAWVDINRVLITVFLFFFFNRFDSNRRDFTDTISLSFFPPGVQWRKGVEKAAAMFWNFLPSPYRLFR